MAINFEAANMAGYNNPKIEVFKAHANENLEIDNAPIKSEIVNSLARGCIPFIRLFVNVDGNMHTQQYLMPLSASRTINQQTHISFTAAISFGETGDPQTLALVYGTEDWPPRLI